MNTHVVLQGTRDSTGQTTKEAVWEEDKVKLYQESLALAAGHVGSDTRPGR